jgi:two-component system, NtrC family, nitrogen regulation response regulator GlnG
LRSRVTIGSVTSGEKDTLDLEASSHGQADLRSIGLTILLHPNVDFVGRVAPLFSSIAGGCAELNRLEPDFIVPGTDERSPLAHAALSRKSVVVRTSERGDVVVEGALENQRVLLDGALSAAPVTLPSTRLEAGVVLELGGCVALLLHYVAVGREPRGDLGLLGQSLAIRRLRTSIAQVADTTTHVLVRGESGSGKELVARALHSLSPRRERAFIAVNAAAIPKEMAAAALFGHSKGAFTGATTAKSGFFGEADGGTLFLDEVGELSRDVQGLLLRATREGEIQPLGEARPRRVDVRLITATDANLEAMVESGDFAMPLFRRLEAFTLHVPPLRKRPDDIARLFIHLLRSELRELGEYELLREPKEGKKPWLPNELMRALLAYPWPGNVAELQTVTRHVAITNRGETRFQWSDWLRARLEPQEKAAAIATAGHHPQPSRDDRPDARSLSDAEVLSAMEQSGFRVARAAEALGVSRSWLHTRIEFCEGLRHAKELGADEIISASQACHGVLSDMAVLLKVSEHGLKLRMSTLGIPFGKGP